MKTVKMMFVSAVAVFTSLTNSASAHSVPVYPATYVIGTTTMRLSTADNAPALTVYLNDIKKSGMEVTITDRSGGTVINESTAHANFAKRYNLEGMPEGAYQLRIEDELQKTIQPFEIKNGHIVLDNTSKQTVIKPRVVGKDNKVSVFYFNPDKEKVTVAIRDDASTVLKEETIDGALTVDRRYNLTKLERGNYTLEVRKGKETYSFPVFVK